MKGLIEVGKALRCAQAAVIEDSKEVGHSSSARQGDAKFGWNLGFVSLGQRGNYRWNTGKAQAVRRRRRNRAKPVAETPVR